MITAHFAELQARRLLALSFELTELDAELNYKRNNVHEFLGTDRPAITLHSPSSPPGHRQVAGTSGRSQSTRS